MPKHKFETDTTVTMDSRDLVPRKKKAADKKQAKPKAKAARAKKPR